MTRNIIIPMRATEAERDQFHDLARANGHKNLSDWLRRMAYSATLSTGGSVSLEHELQETRRQLQAVGNNLNQIAHRLNSGATVDPGPVLADVQSAISDIQAVINSVRPRSYRGRRRDR